MRSPMTNEYQFYFECAVVFLGVVGTAANALILYSLVASKQHKKHMLIVNQNVLDLFSSFFLVVSNAVKLCNIYLTGAVGYWLCILLLSESLVWLGANGSAVNLAAVTVDRYLKVIHPVWSKQKLRPWMMYSAMAFTWLVGIAYNVAPAFETSRVIGGMCLPYVFFKSDVAKTASRILVVLCFYVIMLFIFIFCYGRILLAIRRQANVMVSYGGPSSSASQAQTSQIQCNVIKTMILVCVLYAVARLPLSVHLMVLIFDPSITPLDGRFFASLFIASLYTTTNPFIYATKFDPVKKILRGMIPCKRISVQPGANDGSGGSQPGRGTGQQRY